MKAMRVDEGGTEPLLLTATLERPVPASGELLVRVRAAAVTPSELLWYPTSHAKDGSVRPAAVPGHEFSGTVEAIGQDLLGFAIDQDVYGMNDWFVDGAMAEYCLTVPEAIAAKPAILTHEEAATVPISALTAWQGLVERARVQPGDRVLVHGGAGAVGLFVVQIAKIRGARVVATVSSTALEFVKQLGADEVLDYRASRFDEELRKIDIVFDTVGGDTRDRSWSVLKSSGRMITIASDAEGTGDDRTKGAFFIVEPNHAQLAEIAGMIDAGKLRTFVKAVVPLTDAAFAYSGKLRDERGYGKVVVAMPASQNGGGNRDQEERSSER